MGMTGTQKIADNDFEEEPGGSWRCVGDGLWPHAFTQQLLALSATRLCLPFRKLRANKDACRKGSQLGLCVAQRAATSPTGTQRRGPEGRDTRQRVPK